MARNEERMKILLDLQSGKIDIKDAVKSLKELDKQTKETEKGIFGLNKSISDLVKGALGLNLIASGFRVIGSVIRSVAFDSSRLAAQNETVSAAFESLSASSGKTASVFLNELRTASRGAISDLELMKTANYGIILAGTQLADKLPTLLNIAKVSADATGRSFDFLFQRLVTGIGFVSPRRLDDLGLVLKVADANKSYALMLQKTIEELDGTEQKTAILNATLDQGLDVIKKIGLSTGTFSEKMNQAKASTENLKTEFGGLLNEAFAPFLQKAPSIIKSIRNIFFPTEEVELIKKAQKLESVITGINGAINKLTKGKDFTQTIEKAIGLMRQDFTSPKFLTSFGEMNKLIASGSFAKLPSQVQDDIKAAQGLMAVLYQLNKPIKDVIGVPGSSGQGGGTGLSGMGTTADAVRFSFEKLFEALKINGAFLSEQGEKFSESQHKAEKYGGAIEETSSRLADLAQIAGKGSEAADELTASWLAWRDQMINKVITDVFSALLSTIVGAAIPGGNIVSGIIGALSGGGQQIGPRLPSGGFAEGTTQTVSKPTLFMAGEGGEAETVKIGGGGSGGGGASINISGVFMGDQKQAREFAKMIDKELQFLNRTGQRVS